MESPSDEEIEEAVNRAGSIYNDAAGSAHLQAQILQNQRLISDIEELNGNISELNKNLKAYSRWSRALTLVLVMLGAGTLLANIGFI